MNWDIENPVTPLPWGTFIYTDAPDRDPGRRRKPYGGGM